MTFLSHSIPWLSLSNLFEYHAPRSRPGPQEPNLYCKEGPANRKQLEHFARTFQKTVCEHGLIERGRYSTAHAYRNRAASWTESSLDEPHEREQHARSSDATHEERDTKDSIKTSAEVRMAASSSSSTEKRRVYPTHYSDKYMSLVPPTSGGAYGREGLLANLAGISTWIDHCALKRDSRPSELDEGTSNKLWLDNKSCSDVLRLLLIDAATTNDESQRKQRLSTALLLAHHPGVGLENFLSDGMSCCNLGVGLSALLEKTATVFIYLNLLLAFVGDDQGAELLRPCDSLEKFKPSQYHGVNTITPLLPRPTYMNTPSYNRMFGQVLDEHGHAVEHVLFNPLFAPRPSGRLSKWRMPDIDPTFDFHGYHEQEPRFERDILADRESLAAALKSMWMVLVFCDMVFREADSPINWEYVGLDTIYGLFRGEQGWTNLVGQGWCDYQMDRKEAGGFSFYVNGDVDVYADVSEGGDDSG